MDGDPAEIALLGAMEKVENSVEEKVEEKVEKKEEKKPTYKISEGKADAFSERRTPVQE